MNNSWTQFLKNRNIFCLLKITSITIQDLNSSFIQANHQSLSSSVLVLIPYANNPKSVIKAG